MTTSVSSAYQFFHNKLNRVPVYSVEFEDVTQVYSTHKIPGTSWKNYMQLPRGIAAQVQPEKGTSSIGSVTFVLTDVDGEVTNLVMQGIGGKLVTFRAGFINIASADFATFFTGIVSSYKLTTDMGAYEITIRDPQTLINKSVFDVSATKTTALLGATATDTWYHFVLLPGQTVPVPMTNNLNVAAMTTVLDTAYGVGNWTFSQASQVTVGTTITVVDTSGFLAAGYLQLNNEIIQYTSKTATTFTGLTRAALGSEFNQHAVGTAVKELLRIGPAHPCDIIVSILTNTDKTGLSIPSALVSTATFAAVEASIGSYQMEFRITEKVNAMNFMQEELYSVIACYPVTTGAGLISIREFAEPESTAGISTIEHSSIATDEKGKFLLFTWDGNFSKMINDVIYYYDWNPVTQLFESSYQYPNAASIATFGRSTLVINAKGLRSDIAGTTDFILSRIILILDRYSSTAPIIRVRTILQKNLIEPGEVIALTSTMIPNRATLRRGVTNALYEVVSRAMVFDQGHVDFDLLGTSFSLYAHDNFNRPDSDSLGSKWTENEVAAGVMKIASDQLVLGSTSAGDAGHGIAYLAGSPSGPDQISELRFKSNSNPSGGPKGLSGPAVRISGTRTSCTCYAVTYDPDLTQLRLKKYVNVNLVTTGHGAGSTMSGSGGPTVDTVTLVDGDAVRIEITGSSIVVKLNGSVIFTGVTDTDIVTGQPGFITNADAGSETSPGSGVYEVYSINWDNWSASPEGWPDE